MELWKIRNGKGEILKRITRGSTIAFPNQGRGSIRDFQLLQVHCKILQYFNRITNSELTIRFLSCNFEEFGDGLVEESPIFVNFLYHNVSFSL